MTKFTVTYVNRGGNRQLMGPNQGRFFKETKEEAEKQLEGTLECNEEILKQVFGPQAIGTFEVRPVDCYENGDAKSLYFD